MGLGWDSLLYYVYIAICVDMDKKNTTTVKSNAKAILLLP